MSDVVERSGGLVVVVGGPRARAVPVLARFHEPLRQAAASAGEGYLLGGNAPQRKNLTDTLCAALCRDAGLPRLEAGRLRATWLCGVRPADRAEGVHAGGRRSAARSGSVTWSPSFPRWTSGPRWRCSEEQMNTDGARPA